MKSRVLTSLSFLLKGSALLAHPSLLFTEEEVNFIENHCQRKTNGDGVGLEGFEKLYLSAIVYSDENHWSLWVNNRILRPEDCKDMGPFHLEKVTPYGVHFSWKPPSNSVSRTFTLRPHQTYIVKTEMIVDGIEK